MGLESAGRAIQLQPAACGVSVQGSKGRCSSHLTVQDRITGHHGCVTSLLVISMCDFHQDSENLLEPRLHGIKPREGYVPHMCAALCGPCLPDPKESRVYQGGCIYRILRWKPREGRLRRASQQKHQSWPPSLPSWLTMEELLSITCCSD